MINFDYAFSSPHTMTLSRPSASEKVLVDVSKNGVLFYYQNQSLENSVPLTWKMGHTDISLSMVCSVGKDNVIFNKWRRHYSGAPCCIMESTTNDVQIKISAIACQVGVVVKEEFLNNSKENKQVITQLAHKGGWVISNKGWIDGVNNNLLLTMNEGRADKILAVALNADDYPMIKLDNTGSIETPPMANAEYGVGQNSMKKIMSAFNLKSGDEKIGYYVIPYNKYFNELNELKSLNLEKQIKDALNEWDCLLNRGVQYKIPDNDLLSCYRACLADIFVMREKIGNKFGICCGTNLYRSTNSTEPLEAEILLDSIGYNEVANEDFDTYLTGQDEDGNWAASYAWEHEAWGSPYNKSLAILEHYYISNDFEYLKRNYPRMLASSKFNYRARQSTKNDTKLDASERGLMPRGMGDCGMVYKGDYYGVFYPWNILSVAADGLTLKAARILNKTEDIKFLEVSYNEAKNDLIISMRSKQTKEGDYVRPATSTDGTATTLYGCFFSYFPGGLFTKDEPMIQGALKCIESKKISEGGLPVGTGWLKDGLWVAMALNTISRTYLRMGEFAKARQYLYPAINHASYLMTYCEERGAEKGSKTISGDKQHLWTPLSVCQYMKDAFWFENDESICIFGGIFPEWLNESNTIEANNLYTHFGKTSIKMVKNSDGVRIIVNAERAVDKPIIVHYFENGKDMTKEIFIKSKTIETKI